MLERFATPWGKTVSGDGVDLFLETLSKEDSYRVLNDLYTGKSVSLPSYQGQESREVSLRDPDPSKRIDPENFNTFAWGRHTRGNPNPMFAYVDGEYLPLAQGASPSAVVAKMASALKGRLRKAIESGKPIVFLGGECSDDNEWREELEREFGGKLALVDPYDEDWKAEDNIYDELVALLKADHVVFYKGGKGTDREKDFLKRVGDPDGYESFEDLEALKVYLENLSKPVSKMANSKGEYTRSTTQVDLPEAMAKEIIAWGKKGIPDSDLVQDEKGSMGREDEIHVTVLYGVEDDVPEAVAKVIKGLPSFEVRLGLVTLFRKKDEYDVVKIDAEAPELHAFNKAIREGVPCKVTFPEYVPHVTIAYVKKGAGDKFLGSDEFRGKTFKADHVVFKNKNKESTEIPLKGKS